ncbi:MAG: lipid-A-disaccharide synthase, partial [Alphaproteobacteria bacterium]
LVKTKFANLINIINNKEIIPEFIQSDCRAENLSLFMVNILINSKKEALYKKELEMGLKKIGDPSHSSTDKIIEILSKLL